MFMFHNSSVPVTLPVSVEALQCIQSALREQYGPELQQWEEQQERIRWRSSSHQQRNGGGDEEVLAATTTTSPNVSPMNSTTSKNSPVTEEATAANSSSSQSVDHLFPTIASHQNNTQMPHQMSTSSNSTSSENNITIGKSFTLIFKDTITTCLTAKRVAHRKWNFKQGQFKTEFETFWRLKIEANEKARIMALKNSDTEGYLQHLSNVKVTSLLSIMEATHQFMTKIGAQLQRKGEATPSASSGAIITNNTATTAAVIDKKKAGASENNDVNQNSNQYNNSSDESEEYRRFKEYVASTKDEYKLVHKKTVFVADQPAGISATLMPHQMVGLRFLASLHANGINGILADEMGVGKTLQTLSFLCFLKEAAEASAAAAAAAGTSSSSSTTATSSVSSVLGSGKGPHLVLAPLSIVREWKDAMAMFVTGLNVCCFEDLEDERDANNYNVVLLAVHRVRHFVNELQNVLWHFLIVDEAHKAVSNPDTLTAIAIRSVPARNRLVLTGTPLNNDIQELWSLLNFINPDVFQERASFEHVFRRPFVQAGHMADAAQLTEEERELLILRMHQILRPFMLRRTKRDIDTTLKITYHEVLCPLSALQNKMLDYVRTRSALPALVEGGRAFALQTVCTREKSAQAICNHPFMVPFFSQILLKEEKKGRCSKADHGKWALQSSGKFVVLDLILRRMKLLKRKVVIFSHWLDTVDLLQEYLEYRGWLGAENHYVVLTGASSPDERQECVQLFRNNPDTLVMLLSIKAGGCGLNLQVSNVVIMFDKDYTATNEDQAVARVFRIGQTQTVRAIYLVTKDATETRVAEIAERKNRPRQAIIEGGGYNEQVITEEERQEALQNSMMDLKTVLDLTAIGGDEIATPPVAAEKEEEGKIDDDKDDDDVKVTPPPPPPPPSSTQQLLNSTLSQRHTHDDDDNEAAQQETKAEEQDLLVHSLDPLLYGDKDDALTLLNTTPDRFEQLFISPNDFPVCFQKAFIKCEAPEDVEAYGKGKKRNPNTSSVFGATGNRDLDDPFGLSTTLGHLYDSDENGSQDPLGLRFIPPDAFMDKFLDLGWDEEDIVALYRKEIEQKERLKLHACDVSFVSSTSVLDSSVGPHSTASASSAALVVSTVTPQKAATKPHPQQSPAASAAAGTPGAGSSPLDRNSPAGAAAAASASGGIGGGGGGGASDCAASTIGGISTIKKGENEKNGDDDQQVPMSTLSLRRGLIAVRNAVVDFQ